MSKQEGIATGQYMTAKQAAEKWGISLRRVSHLCQEGRIPGIAKIGAMWFIPIDLDKPEDARRKSVKERRG